MGKVPSLVKVLLAVICVSWAALSAARQTGGSYTLSINGGTPFPISSLDFGSNSAANHPTGAAAGRTQLSPVTITASEATPQLYSLFSSCLKGEKLAKLTAVYANAQGQTQFTVEFQSVVITGYTFPTVDSTPGPLGDISITFAAGKEQFSTPQASKPLTANRVAIKSNIVTPTISRSWHTLTIGPSVGTKFTFTIPNANTSGVTSVLSFAVKSPPEAPGSGGGAGKAAFTSFAITVNLNAGQAFIKSAQANAHVAALTLVFNRPGPTGANLPITLVFHNVLFSGFNIGGDHPVATINLTAESIEVQTAGPFSNYNLETLKKTL